MSVNFLPLTTGSKALRATLVVLIVVGAVISIIFQVYFVQDGSGGRIFWKQGEADLFMSASHIGHQCTYLTYPFYFVTTKYLFMTTTPTHETHASLLIRVTPSGVERRALHISSRAIPLFVTPLDDGFYAMCQGGILCKLTGSVFTPATEDEQHRHDGVKHLVRGGTGFADGWSERDVVSTPNDHFQIEIDKGLTISAINHATDGSQSPRISVNLVKDGQIAETLYDVDGTARRVNKNEYETTFTPFLAQ